MKINKSFAKSIKINNKNDHFKVFNFQNRDKTLHLGCIILLAKKYSSLVTKAKANFWRGIKSVVVSHKIYGRWGNCNSISECKHNL